MTALLALFLLLVLTALVFCLVPLLVREAFSDALARVRGDLLDAQLAGTLPSVPEVDELSGFVERLGARPRLVSLSSILALRLASPVLLVRPLRRRLLVLVESHLVGVAALTLVEERLLSSR